MSGHCLKPFRIGWRSEQTGESLTRPASLCYAFGVQPADTAWAAAI